MGKIAVKRLWSRHNVPMEIWSDILARLPVRSLVRFRCVSRSWKVLIDDPDFCQEHLVQFKNNRDETHLLMVQGSGAGAEHYFVRCSDTMKTSRSLGYIGMLDKKTRERKSTATPGFSGYWSIWFSVDGLYMLRCRVDKAKLMLWNPSIRKCRLVLHSHDTNKFLELGLGFDPLIKDYKLVRVSRSSACSVEIYTVETASWRTVVAQGTVTSSWLQTAHQRIYCKGCLYILSKTKLISFDLSREVFKSVDLPRYDNFLRHLFRESFALVDGGSSLAVIHYSMSYGGSIWVLDNNAAALSWSMRYTFTMGVPNFLYLKKNGDLLFKMYSHRQVLSYNIHTEEERQTNCPKSAFHIVNYKESLVLLN